MCARMTITTTPKEVADLFGLATDTRFDAEKGRYNVAPSTLVPSSASRTGAGNWFT